MRISIPPFLVAVLACAAPHAPAAAQIEASAAPRAFCWAGRPGDECRTFLVADAGAYTVVGGTRYTRTDFDGSRDRKRHLTGHVAWEAGVMRNVTTRDAVGATLMAGADANGERLALKGRYRRWTGPRSAVDVAAGVLHARRAEPYPDPDVPGNLHVAALGLTGDLSVGLTEWASASVRGDLLFDADGTSSGVYGGVKLGTRPGLAATAIPFLAAGLIYLVAGSSS